jgi:hypothetical protein
MAHWGKDIKRQAYVKWVAPVKTPVIYPLDFYSFNVHCLFMKLSTVRDLLIVIAIYLYFIAWIYLHTYYSHFGVATESLRLDYSSYLIFSYNVLLSKYFLTLVIISGAVVTAGFILTRFLLRSASFHKKRQYKKILNSLLMLLMVVLFPVLYRMAKSSAIDDYARDRTSIGSRRRIEFFFRPDAALHNTPDSSSYHIQFLLRDRGRTLRLLGETDEHYIVLHQKPYDTLVQSHPEGSVYYVSKKDVLLSRIVLSSR